MKSNSYQFLNSRRTLLLPLVFGVLFFILLSTIFHPQIRSNFSAMVSTVRSRACNSEPAKMISFSDYDEFQSIGSEADQVWDNIVTPNGGYFYQTESNGHRYGSGISMFHQLHCLQMIRTKIQVLSFPNGSYGPPGTRQIHAHAHHVDDDHVMHCLDYVRQGILCCADGTIEPPKKTEDGRDIANYKLPHTCGDSKRLYALSLQSDRHEGYHQK